MHRKPNSCCSIRSIFQAVCLQTTEGVPAASSVAQLWQTGIIPNHHTTTTVLHKIFSQQPFVTSHTNLPGVCVRMQTNQLLVYLSNAPDRYDFGPFLRWCKSTCTCHSVRLSLTRGHQALGKTAPPSPALRYRLKQWEPMRGQITKTPKSRTTQQQHCLKFNRILTHILLQKRKYTLTC